MEVAEIQGLQQKVTDFIKLQRERFMNGSAISVASIRSAWHGVAGAVGLDHDPSNSATRQLSKTKKKADSFIHGGAIEPDVKEYTYTTLYFFQLKLNQLHCFNHKA